jgi:hypothetical protein
MEANFPAIPVKAVSLGCDVRERLVDGVKITHYVKRLRCEGAPPINVEICRVEQKGDDIEVFVWVLVPADEDMATWGFSHSRGEGKLLSGDLSSGQILFTNKVPGTTYEKGDLARFVRNDKDFLPLVEVSNV